MLLSIVSNVSDLSQRNVYIVSNLRKFYLVIHQLRNFPKIYVDKLFFSVKLNVHVRSSASVVIVIHNNTRISK